MSDKPRDIRWEDLQYIYEMQMRGKNPYIEDVKPIDFGPLVKDHDKKIRREMHHQLYSLMWDITNGRNP